MKCCDAGNKLLSADQTITIQPSVRNGIPFFNQDSFAQDNPNLCQLDRPNEMNC